MADQELLAVRRWSEGQNYEDWNEALRQPDSERATKLLHENEPGIRALGSALNKMPEPAEPVALHRGLAILDPDMPSFLEKAEAGKVFQDPGFASTDAKAPWAGSNVEMTIETKQARDISELSSNPHFQEHLLKPNSTLEVVHSYPDPERAGKWQVALEDTQR